MAQKKLVFKIDLTFSGLKQNINITKIIQIYVFNTCFDLINNDVFR